MTRFPSFPKIDLTSFDLSKLPSIDLPKFDVPKVDFTELDDKVVATVKNAAYLTVGFGVAALERLDSARRSVNAVASDAVESLTAAVSTTVGRVAKRAA
jgi:hypothetical protein